MGNYQKLTLLHSNDMHGDFMAEEGQDALIGGVSMLSGYVNKVRAEEDSVLYCVAGDMFRGSVIDSEFKGISTIEIMNGLMPDIVTIGNHEVDYGLSHLLFLEKCARFPIINANLHITTNGARLFQPYKVIEIDGLHILFIGILTEEVLASTKSDEMIGTFVDCAEAAQEVGRICNAHNAIDIDLTVLLTHIGYEEDRKLAEMLDPSWGVDIIIGGHSHTLPEEAIKVNDVLIVQAGTGTDQIGRFDLTIDTDNNCVADYTWRTVPITSENCPKDPSIEKLIRSYKLTTDVKYNRVVTKFYDKMTHPKREQETSLGNLVADAMAESLGVDVMLFGSGSIRKTALGPLVLYKDFVECFPYDDPVYLMVVTGAQFKHMIKHMVRDEVWEGAHCEFYQLSDGLEIDYNRTTHEFEKFNFRGAPLADEAMLKVALPHYHFVNLKVFFDVEPDEIEKNQKFRIICTSLVQVLEEYFTENPQLYREVCGRLTVHK